MSLSGPSQQLTESNLLEQLAHLKHSLCHCCMAHKGTCVSHWNWEGPQRVLRSITHSYSQFLQSLFSNKFSWKIIVPISIETETEAFLLLLLSNQRLENRNRSCEWKWNKRKQRSELPGASQDNTLNLAPRNEVSLPFSRGKHVD